MATRTIGTRLAITGEAEYKRALKEAVAELSNMKAGLKLVSEQYKESANTTEALRQKVEKLTSAKKAQEAVIESLKAGLANARTQQELYAQKTQEMERKTAEASLRLEELKNTAGDTQKEQEELTQAIAEYTKGLEESRNGQTAAEESVQSWQLKLTNADTSLKRLDTELEKQGRYLKEAEGSSDGCAKSIDQYGKAVRKASEDSEQLKSHLAASTAAIDAMAVTMLSSGVRGTLQDIAGALMECAEAAAEFETGIAKVATIADTSRKPMETIKTEIVALSSELGVAVGEISEAAYNAISASVNTADSVKFVGMASKLAIGGFTDSTTSVDILTTALNAYKLSVDEVGRVSDYLITTQKLGKTTVGELASSMGRVIPVASAYNVEMDNLSAAYAIMTANGIATAESTTYLKAMLNELGDSEKDVAAALEEHTGKSFAELTKQGYSLGDVMQILGNIVDNDTGAFNEMWSSAEAGIGALSLLGAGSEKYNDVLMQMRNSTGATEEAFGLMADTAEMARQRMGVAVDNMKIAVGDVLNPALEDLYEKGGNAFGWAAEFVQEHPEVVQAITAITVGVAALATGLVVLHGALLAVEAVQKMIESHPTALIVTAVVAAVAALGTYALTMEMVGGSEGEAARQAREFAEGVKELNAAIEESRTEYEQQQNAIEESTQSCRKMVRQLEQLTGREEKSAADREAILSLVEKLNEEVPELALKYDAETDALNRTGEAIRETIDAYADLSEYDAAVERQTVLLEENSAKSEELTAATQLLAEAQAALSEVQQQYNDDSYVGAYTIAMAQAEVNKYSTAVEEASEALRENVLEYNAASAEINAYTVAHAALLPQSQAAIASALEQAEALRDDELAYQQMVGALAEAAEAHAQFADDCRSHIDVIRGRIDELRAAYDEARESARESIDKQIGLFEEVEIKGEESIEDLMKSLQSQEEYMNTYAENIYSAMELGVDQGIIEKLSDGSQQSAAYLAAIVASGQEEITALNEEFKKVEEGKNAFSEAVAKMVTDFGDEMLRLQEDYQETIQELNRFDEAFAATVKTCQGITEGVDSEWASVVGKNKSLSDALMAEMDDYEEGKAAAINSCRGIEAGIDARWDSVVEKYRSLAKATWDAVNREYDSHSPSRKFKWSAEMTMEGLESGVELKLPDVKRTYQEAAAAAYQAYEQESRSMAQQAERGQTMMLAFTASVPEPVRMAASDAPGRQLYRQSRTEQRPELQSARAVNQTVNIYQPVESPIETARALRKAGREMWLDG